MKISQILGVVVCALLVTFMAYITLTKDGGYTTSKQTEEKLALNTPPILGMETDNPSEEMDERDKQLLELQRSVQSGNSQKTSRLFASKCSACHGKNGEGRFDENNKVIFPKIAGKKRDFILSRLSDYKENRVPNPLMKGLLANLNNEDMNDLATEISAFEGSNE